MKLHDCMMEGIESKNLMSVTASNGRRGRDMDEGLCENIDFKSSLEIYSK